MKELNYHGSFQGFVSAIDDPEKRGRVRLSIPDMFTDPETQTVVDSPWAEAKGSLGAGTGFFGPPPVGAPVWVQVRYSDDGEVYQLVYEAGRFGEIDGAADVPPTAKGEDDESSGPLKSGVPFQVPAADTALAVPGLAAGSSPLRQEKIGALDIPRIPPSANAGEYGENRVFKTPGGLVIEVDDTPGAARFHIWHPEGTYVEVNDKGVWTQRSTKRWEEVAESATDYIGGDVRRRVNGHLQMGVGKNSVEQVGGRKVVLAQELDIQTRMHLLTEVGGRYNLKVLGHAKERFTSGKLTAIGGDNTVSWAGRGNFSSLGDVQVACAQVINAFATLGVNVGTARMTVAPPLPGAALTATPVAHAAPLVAVLAAMIPALTTALPETAAVLTPLLDLLPTVPSAVLMAV